MASVRQHTRQTRGRRMAVVAGLTFALGLAIMAVPSGARTAPSAPCRDTLLFKAAQAAEGFGTSHGYSHISPPGATEAVCDAGWAVAAISRPIVGTTDGYTLFRSEAAHWREVGQLGGSIATCQLKRYHVPSRVALILARGHVHSGIAGC